MYFTKEILKKINKNPVAVAREIPKEWREMLRSPPNKKPFSQRWVQWVYKDFSNNHILKKDDKEFLLFKKIVGKRRYVKMFDLLLKYYYSGGLDPDDTKDFNEIRAYPENKEAMKIESEVFSFAKKYFS